MSVFLSYFGLPSGAVYSNLIASAICSVVVYLRMRAKLHASERALAGQAERHQVELRAQAQAHHNELRKLAEKHHLQALDRIEAHTAELKAHVSAAIPTRKVSRSG